METIKVKEVMYISKLGVIVAKGRLILIPHELTDSMDSVLEDKEGSTWRPIIVSETENPEIGEYIYHTPTKTIAKFVKGDMHYRKILALPEQLNEYYMGRLRDGAFKDGEKVLVRCSTTSEDEYVVELGTSGHVIIQTPYDYCELIDFYEWYRKSSTYPKSLTRAEVLRELETRLGIPKA